MELLKSIFLSIDKNVNKKLLYRVKILQSVFSVVSQFEFGVADAAVVVTTASLNVVKLTEVSMQLVFLHCSS